MLNYTANRTAYADYLRKSIEAETTIQTVNERAIASARENMECW